MKLQTLLGLALLPLWAGATATQVLPLSGMGEPGEQPPAESATH